MKQAKLHAKSSQVNQSLRIKKKLVHFEETSEDSSFIVGRLQLYRGCTGPLLMGIHYPRRLTIYISIPLQSQ